MNDNWADDNWYASCATCGLVAAWRSLTTSTCENPPSRAVSTRSTPGNTSGYSARSPDTSAFGNTPFGHSNVNDLPSGDVIRNNAPGGNASCPAASSAVEFPLGAVPADGDVGGVGSDAVGDAVATGTSALSPVSGSDGIVFGSAGGGADTVGVGGGAGSAAGRRGAFRTAAPAGGDAAEPPAPNTSFVVVDRVANPPGPDSSVVSTSRHPAPDFTRTGNTCCVQVNDPSGFAIVVLVAVNDVSTRTGWFNSRARRWASSSSTTGGVATADGFAFGSSSTSTVRVPTPSAAATIPATTVPVRRGAHLPGHRNSLADTDTVPAP